jgi:hypothetical protein
MHQPACGRSRPVIDSPSRFHRYWWDWQRAASQSSSSVGQALLNKCQRSAFFGSGASTQLTYRPPLKRADDSLHSQAERGPPCCSVWMTPWAHPSQPLMVSAMTLVEIP